MSEILETIGKTPLFGHPNGSKIPTHWFCFMKIPSEEQLIATPLNSKGSQEANSLNMGDKVSASPTPKDASHPSHHPNIMFNKSEGLKR